MSRFNPWNSFLEMVHDMKCDRSCPRQENNNVHEIHCISHCRSLIRTEYITRFIHHPFRCKQMFLVTHVECPSHFKTLKSVVFGTVSQQFIHILLRKSTQSESTFKTLKGAALTQLSVIWHYTIQRSVVRSSEWEYRWGLVPNDLIVSWAALNLKYCH